ncbi:MAG: hypothetical protein JXR76_14230 [Deltaproteobacteria bacterium]|nr:hypothetical protein [Deltaproteobacteria bacterium]
MLAFLDEMQNEIRARYQKRADTGYINLAREQGILQHFENARALILPQAEARTGTVRDWPVAAEEIPGEYRQRR